MCVLALLLLATLGAGASAQTLAFYNTSTTCTGTVEIATQDVFTSQADGCLASGGLASFTSCVGSTGYFSGYLGSTCSGTPLLATSSHPQGTCVPVSIDGATLSYIVTCPPVSASVYVGANACSGQPTQNLIPGVCQPFAFGARMGFAQASCDNTGTGSVSYYSGAADCSGTATLVVTGATPGTCRPVVFSGSTVVGLLSMNCVASPSSSPTISATSSVTPTISVTPSVTPSPSPAAEYVQFFTGSTACTGNSITALSEETCASNTLNGTAISINSTCSGSTAYITPYMGTANCDNTPVVGTLSSASGVCTAVPGTSFSYIAKCPSQAAAFFMGADTTCAGQPATDSRTGVCHVLRDPNTHADIGRFLVSCDGNGQGTMSVYAGATACTDTASAVVTGASGACNAVTVGGNPMGHVLFTCPKTTTSAGVAVSASVALLVAALALALKQGVAY